MGNLLSKKKSNKYPVIGINNDNKSLQPLKQITIETMGECCICNSEMKIGYHISNVKMNESKFVCKVCCIDMLL